MISRRSVLIALAVAGGAFAATHLLPIPSSVNQLTSVAAGQPIFDLRPSFSADEVYQRLAGFGEVGRAIYRRMVVSTDIVFPLCVFAFLFLFGRYTGEKLRPPRPMRMILHFMPFLYLGADLLENAMIFTMLSDYPQRHDLIASNLGYVTTAKRIGQFAAILLPALLFFIRDARQHRVE